MQNLWQLLFSTKGKILRVAKIYSHNQKVYRFKKTTTRLTICVKPGLTWIYVHYSEWCWISLSVVAREAAETERVGCGGDTEATPDPVHDQWRPPPGPVPDPRVRVPWGHPPTTENQGAWAWEAHAEETHEVSIFQQKISIALIIG